MGENSTRRGILSRVTIAAFLVGGMMTIGSAPAGADPGDDPVGTLLGTVGQVLDPDSGSATPAPKVRSSLPTREDDDSTGHETTDPSGGDHGSGDGLQVTLADQDVAQVGGSDAGMDGDGSTTADSTVLALGGQEILGAHADSDGTGESSAGDPLEPLCSGTDDAVCVQLLYADASAANGHSESSSGVAAVCVGGSDSDATDCDGAIGAGAVQSQGQVDRTASGRTRASSGSSAATVCLQRDPVLGTCTVDADALTSQGRADSDGTASKDSQVLGLDLAGTVVANTSEPSSLALPPDCADPGLACVFLNNGETYVARSAAGHAVAALDASLLDGTALATVAHSETLVHQGDAPDGPSGPDDPQGGPTTPEPGSVPVPQAGGTPTDAVLPNTGGVLSGFLTLGLLGVGLGSLLVAWSRHVACADGSA